MAILGSEVLQHGPSGIHQTPYGTFAGKTPQSVPGANICVASELDTITVASESETLTIASQSETLTIASETETLTVAKDKVC